MQIKVPEGDGSAPKQAEPRRARRHLRLVGAATLGNPTGESSYTVIPETLGIEITGRCNLRCRHCFNDSSPDNEAELDLPSILRLLDEAVRWSLDSVRISGGEPTAHRDFEAVVEGCRARGLRVVLNTNGIYSPSMLSYLEGAPIDLFMLSIDGMQEANDLIRGPGTFQRTIAAVKRLVSAKQRVMFACHLTRSNCADVGALVELGVTLGVSFKFSPVRPIGRARRELAGDVITREEYRRVVVEIERLRRLHPRVSIKTDFDILGPQFVTSEGASACKAGRSMVNVNYDGNIYPCAFFATDTAEFSAGNVRDTKVTDVWTNPGTFAAFRIHAKSSSCQTCSDYRGACAGGCPAIAHFQTGRLDALDPTCFKAPDPAEREEARE